jgi:hypothetical protein
MQSGRAGSVSWQLTSDAYRRETFSRTSASIVSHRQGENIGFRKSPGSQTVLKSQAMIVAATRKYAWIK